MIAPRNSAPPVRDHVEEPDDRPSALVLLNHMEEEGWPNDQRLGNDGIGRFLERQVIEEISLPEAAFVAWRYGLLDQADGENAIQDVWAARLKRWAEFTPNEIRKHIEQNPDWLENGLRHLIPKRAIEQKRRASRRGEVPLEPHRNARANESGGMEEGWTPPDPQGEAPFDAILTRSEVDWLVREIERHLWETTSPRNRSRVRRWVSLLKMDVQWHREQGGLPSTKEVIQRLKFPSASVVSQARARYRKAAREIRARDERA